MIKTKEDLFGCYAVRADKEVFELFMQKCEQFGIKWHGDCEPRENKYGIAAGYDGECLAHGGELSFVGSKKLTLDDFNAVFDLRNTYCHKDSPHFDEYCNLIRNQKLLWNMSKKLLDDWRGFPVAVLNAMGVTNNNEITNHTTDMHLRSVELKEFKGVKTKTRTEYKPVTMRDYEALQEFHAGKEFYHNTNNYKLVTNTQTLIQAHQHKSLYTKEEVELDWRDVVNEYEVDNDAFVFGLDGDVVFRASSEDFLRMCHEVAEITEKPE